MINGPPPLGKTLVRICLSVSSSNCNLIIIDHHHNCRFQHQRHLCHDDHDENHQARRAVSLEASVEASHCIRRKPASVLCFFSSVLCFCVFLFFSHQLCVFSFFASVLCFFCISFVILVLDDEAQLRQKMMTLRRRMSEYKFCSPGLITNLLEVLWEIANCNLLLIVNGL